MKVINDCFLHGRYQGDACDACTQVRVLREQVTELENALQSARDAGPVMWTCDTCGFSCDIATEPLGTGVECMACENKAFRARLGIES